MFDAGSCGVASDLVFGFKVCNLQPTTKAGPEAFVSVVRTPLIYRSSTSALPPLLAAPGVEFQREGHFPRCRFPLGVEDSRRELPAIRHAKPAAQAARAHKAAPL